MKQAMANKSRKTKIVQLRKSTFSKKVEEMKQSQGKQVKETNK
jgi:hypothetical protein